MLWTKENTYTVEYPEESVCTLLNNKGIEGWEKHRAVIFNRNAETVGTGKGLSFSSAIKAQIFVGHGLPPIFSTLTLNITLN